MYTCSGSRGVGCVWVCVWGVAGTQPGWREAETLANIIYPLDSVSQCSVTNAAVLLYSLHGKTHLSYTNTPMHGYCLKLLENYLDRTFLIAAHVDKPGR